VTLVVHVVAAVVLLDEGDLAIGAPVTIDREGAVLVASTTLDSAVEDIQVIDCHGVLSAVLVVLSSPGSGGAGHKERAAVLLEGPYTRDLFAIELAVVHHEMLANVLLLEVIHAIGFNMTVDHEFANIIATSAPDDVAGASLELEPRHRVLLPSLLVVSLPHGVAGVHDDHGAGRRDVHLHMDRLRVMSGRMILFS